jgi:predicted O-methyltransferase YrrM
MNIDAFEVVKLKYLTRAADEEALMKQLGSAGMARRDEFLLPIGLEVAEFIHSLIIASKAKYAVEIGTSYGYSTLFLANAISKNGGKLHSFELDVTKQNYAKTQIEAAGLGQYVEWHLGDATQELPKLSNEVDFVLLDIWKELYIPCFDIIYPKIKAGGILLADNMLAPKIHQQDAELYRTHVRGHKDIEAVLLNIGAGIDLVVKS